MAALEYIRSEFKRNATWIRIFFRIHKRCFASHFICLSRTRKRSQKFHLRLGHQRWKWLGLSGRERLLEKQCYHNPLCTGFSKQRRLWCRSIIHWFDSMSSKVCLCRFDYRVWSRDGKVHIFREPRSLTFICLKCEPRSLTFVNFLGLKNMSHVHSRSVHVH